MKKSAIVVAGGTGTRMNAAVPKQFLPLAGKPLVMHSLRAFSDAFPGILLVLALPHNQFGAWHDLCLEHRFTLPHRIVAGGETRFHSVKNALAALPSEGLVAIHDGARPLVSIELIRRTFELAEILGNCIPVVPVAESVRMLRGEASSPLDRETLRIVQTPQVFGTDLLREAYRQEYQERFTDDAMVMESMGATIHLAEGDPFNIKITRPHDLAVAGILYRESHL